MSPQCQRLPGPDRARRGQEKAGKTKAGQAGSAHTAFGVQHLENPTLAAPGSSETLLIFSRFSIVSLYFGDLLNLILCKFVIARWVWSNMKCWCRVKCTRTQCYGKSFNNLLQQPDLMVTSERTVKPALTFKGCLQLLT